MNLNLGEVKHAGQWALRIAEAVGAEEYVNPHGGTDIFDAQDFKDAGIKLTFLENRLAEYDQHRESFEPGLSIIDLMMFNSIEPIHKMLNDVAEY